MQQRIRNLIRASILYYRSWRGIALGGVVLTSALLLVFTSVDPLVLVAASLPVGLILVLQAHNALRTNEQIAEIDLQKGVKYNEAGEQTAYPINPPPDELSSPDATIVVVAFNEARYISTCLHSLQAQTHPNWEAVVVDDASTDETRDIALSFARKDPRFRVVSLETNSGPALGRNVGLTLAKSPFITFMDGDDFLYPEAVSQRLAAMPEFYDEPWCAGVYCNWANVSEAASESTDPPLSHDQGTVTWFDALSDAPFIVSAPILRTAAVRSLGGFRDVASAEDADLWNRLLRHGWSVRSVPYTGVAYRMKHTSRFRRDPVAMAETIEAMARSNAESAEPATSHRPYFFNIPYPELLPGITRVRRLIQSLAAAIELGDDTSQLEANLGESFEAHHAWTIDLDTVVTQAARRVTTHLGTQSEVPMQRTLRELESIVLRFRDRAKREVVSRLSDGATSEPLPTSPWRAYAPVKKYLVPPRYLSAPSSPVKDRLILLPSANYHVDEVGPIAELLHERGITCVVMASDRRWSLTRSSMAGYQIQAIEAVEAGAWLMESRGLFTFNDWGEYGRDYVETSKELGVPTLAKVEGVQDFNDDDVQWDRKAYQRADIVLAQGQNDVAALPNQDTRVVGSTRLERIWRAPARTTHRREVAVLNLNFTYGVLDDARDLWLLSAIAACEKANMPFVISLHPAEKDRYEGRYPIANDPMRHLLTYASILISRFSTVPFEAMARGVPFIYHNPHGEKVPTFQEPQGAFEVSNDVKSLVAAIHDSRSWVDNYRERASDFFLRQVDVDPDRPSEVRSADVITDVLGVG